MKAFLASVVALIVIAVGSNWGLNEIGFSAADRTISDSVRLSD